MARPKKDTDRFEYGRDVEDVNILDERYSPMFSDEDIRKNLQMGYVDKLWVNPKNIPDDVVVAWATETVLGQEKPGGISSMLQIGWEPAPLDRHTEFHIDPRIDGGRSREGNVIRRMGNILMQRKKHYHELDIKLQAERNLKSLDLARAMERNNSVFPVGLGGFTSKGNSVTLSRVKEFN